MGWDGSGNIIRNSGIFQGATLWQQTRDANREIRADDHDTHDEDLATSIENTVTRDGQNQPTQDLPMGGFKHSNVGNAALLNEYAALGQVQEQQAHVCTVAGTGDAIDLTCDFPPSSYKAGQKFVFFSGASNTGPTTANVNGLGAVEIKKRAGDSLEADDIVSSELCVLYYDGGAFQLSTLSNQGLARSGASTTMTYTQDGAGVGPILILLRESASPNGGDQIGDVALRGRTSTGSAVNYARLRGVINDPTAGATQGRFDVITQQGGAETLSMTVAKGVQVGVPNGGDKGNGAINAQEVYANGDRVYPLVTGLGTPVATTSGTQFDFTDIRADARRVTVIFEGVSLTGGDGVLVQIGSGGYDTTGYNSTAARLNAGGIGVANSTAGFILDATQNAASLRSGRMVLTLIDPSTNTWVMDGNGKTTNGETFNCGGDKSLSGALTQLRITRTGSNTFDAGKVNVLVE